MLYLLLGLSTPITVHSVCQTDQYDAFVLSSAMVGLVRLEQENAASGGIYSVWLLNNHVDLHIYWTVYQLHYNA